jgi:uncharacterized membrane protein
VVITFLFLEVLTPITLEWLVAIFFMASTVALVVGLAYFLREVYLSIHTVRIPSAAYRK